MAESNGGWEKKLTAISGLFASVLVPVALGLAGHWYSNAQTESRNSIALIQIALDILRDPETDIELKRWAVDIVDHRSEVEFSEKAKMALLEGGEVLPPSTAVSDAPAVSARVAEMGVIQSEAIAALLERDLDRAISAYDEAYRLWPVFRNVDEIRRTLKALNENSRGRDPTDQQWQALFDYLVRMDLRGVDPDLRRKLQAQAEQD